MKGAGIVETIEAMSQRLEKARALVRDGKVRKVEGEDSWVVENEEGKFYLVQNSTCTCQDFQQRKDLHKGWCKHRLAIALTKKNGKEGK